MPRPRRRLVFGVLLIAGMILTVATLRLGWEWKQALDNVDAMIVTPMTLPTTIAASELQHNDPASDVFPPQPTAAPQSSNGDSALPVVLPTPVPTIGPWADGPVNILLLGTDARPGEDISRTDAIILVHFDPRSKRVSMLSIPRDLWVRIPGYGQARINAAYLIGEREFGPGYGPALAKETVAKLLGVPVHHFVLINFEGFRTLIDKLDGIYVDVPRPIDDPAYPTDDYRTIEIHFDAGLQRMSGDRALIYARTRHADSDFGRNQRQQQVLMAIFDRVREQGLLSQLTSLDDYTGALRDYVRTDLSRRDMLSLAQAGTGLRDENVHRYAIEPAMIVNLEHPATFAADPRALKRIVNQMLSDSVASAGGEDPSR